MYDVELPLASHLEELRIRLGRSLGAIAIGMALCYPRTDILFGFLTAPLTQAAADIGSSAMLVGTGVAEAFFTRLKVAAIAGVFATLPITLWQIWMFIQPGFRGSENNYARSFVLFGSVFFLSGAAFCYLMVLPLAFPFFLSEYASIGIEPVIRISEYLSFVSRLLLAFGITFEMPVTTFFLARAGLITDRTLIHYGRYAVVGIFVLAAILTPPDVVSQTLMAGPLLCLYVISIFVARAFSRKPVTTDDGDDGDDSEKAGE
ncbi:MAG: sec-independent protein translocase protein TatC [Hyphomicrobiaceae bacterium]|jgi:sec-independent protein translocase protein TatC